jgi:hypothetical protein
MLPCDFYGLRSATSLTRILTSATVREAQLEKVRERSI